MKRVAFLSALCLILAGCVTDASMQVAPGVQEIAVQRMRFAAEAVCLNNRSRSSQDRAARALDFPIRQREGSSTVYVNPATLTFIRLGPAPDQAVTTPAGERVVFRGTGCSVGSPAVGVRTANRLVGEILAPRLVEGGQTLSAPVGAGTNDAGGVGLFFDDLSVTLPIARTTFTNPDTGQAQAFDHPVILVFHR